VSADSVVPGAGKPQALNRYAYVNNSPLNYVDPTGHCGKADGKDDEEEECQKAIGDIEKNYRNIKVNAKRWSIRELQLVLKALSGHMFSEDINTARSIQLLRSEYIKDDKGNNLDTVAGETRSEKPPYLDFTIEIADSAWYAPPDANSSGTWFWWEENFLGTVIHEFTHLAAARNPNLLATFKAAGGAAPFFNSGTPIGQGAKGILSYYAALDRSYGTNREPDELMAMTVAAYQLTPNVFTVSDSWWGGPYYTHWTGKWAQAWYYPTPIAGPR
jgi:hypothetical protein